MKEPTWNEEEIRAAAGGWDIEEILARLNGTKIHPDVPVILEWDNGRRYYTNAGDSKQPPGYRTIIAIPAERVMDMLEKALGSRRDLNQYVAAHLEMDAQIADYTKNGPETYFKSTGGRQ